MRVLPTFECSCQVDQHRGPMRASRSQRATRSFLLVRRLALSQSHSYTTIKIFIGACWTRAGTYCRCIIDGIAAVDIALSNANVCPKSKYRSEEHTSEL